MARVALYTADELTAAFALILPPDEAEPAALRWFAECVLPDDLDAAGRYVYDDRDRLGAGLILGSRPGDAIDPLIRPNPLSCWESLRDSPIDEKVNFLMHFSDFHISLASLVSADIAQRVQEYRGQSDEQAARSQRNMMEVARTIRGLA